MATITQRGDSYKITVSCGYDLSGKQIRRHLTWKPEPGMTQRQVKKELDRQAVLFEEKCRSGQVLDGNIRFADFAEKWFTDYAEKQLRPTTVAGYRKLTARIYPAIGHIRLDKLQPHHLMAFYNNLSEDGIKRNTAMHLRDNWAALLKERGLTQAEVARQVGIHAAQLSRAAHGSGVLRQNAETIAAVLNLPLEEVFEPAPSGCLSGNTVQHYHRLISSILSTSIHRGQVAGDLCKSVRPGRPAENTAQGSAFPR